MLINLIIDVKTRLIIRHCSMVSNKGTSNIYVRNIPAAIRVKKGKNVNEAKKLTPIVFTPPLLWMLRKPRLYVSEIGVLLFFCLFDLFLFFF